MSCYTTSPDDLVLSEGASTGSDFEILGSTLHHTSQTIAFPPSHSDVQEAAGAEAPDAGAAAPSSSSPAPEAASSSSSAPAAAPSSPEAAKEAPSSPKLVVEADRASQMSGSGCTSQASVDDEDDVPITDIYFVRKTLHTHVYTRTHTHIYLHTHTVYF